MMELEDWLVAFAPPPPIGRATADRQVTCVQAVLRAARIQEHPQASAMIYIRGEARISTRKVRLRTELLF